MLAEPPLLLLPPLLAPVVEDPLDPEVPAPELLVLEPHAARPIDAATTRPTALMRLVLTLISFVDVAGSLGASRPRRVTYL
ncbi:MAG: hypothetical protein ACR2QA_11945 [Solirubrobacteraceae bacterium]